MTVENVPTRSLHIFSQGRNTIAVGTEGEGGPSPRTHRRARISTRALRAAKGNKGGGKFKSPDVAGGPLGPRDPALIGVNAFASHVGASASRECIHGGAGQNALTRSARVTRPKGPPATSGF